MIVLGQELRGSGSKIHRAGRMNVGPFNLSMAAIP